MSESLGVLPENALSLKLHNTICGYEDEDLMNNMMDSPRETENNNETGKNTPKLSSAVTPTQSTRSTRSRDNPEFVEKQKKFMAKVQVAMGVDPMSRPETPVKRKRESSSTPTPGNNKKRKALKVDNNGQDYQNDNYCWECHREGVFICCEMCPRVFHLKCAGMEKEPEEDWACSECHAVMEAENIENRSRAMQMISVEQLCTLLRFALNRLKSMPGMEPFTKPVDINEFPTYREMVVHPVNFISLERNIKRKFYGSTEAFSSDARWIAHNSVIFNGANSKVTAMAKSLVKILKQDMSEIETCPDCYLNAHQKPKTWFIEACRSAHPLIWARLKGFPFWPAKAVKLKDGSVDVRFFGRHDRSWVPVKECFLFSEQMPTPLKNRNKTLEACLQEVSEHIVKLRERFGKFRYAPHRLPYNPAEPEQIKIILPNYKGHLLPRVRGQSRALSRLSGHSDDETSSIASTDSGTSSIRKNRGSGASTTTETEAEVQNENAKFNNKAESDADEDENSRDVTNENKSKVTDKVEEKDNESDKKEDYDEMEGVDLLLGLRNNNDINKCIDSKVDDVGSPASSLRTRDEDETRDVDEEFEDEVPKGVMENSDIDDDNDDIDMTEEHLDMEPKELKQTESLDKKDEPKDGDETSSDKGEKENKGDGGSDKRENLGESGGSRSHDNEDPKRDGSGGAGKEDGDDDEKENKDRRISDENEKENENEKEEDEDEEDDDDEDDKKHEGKKLITKLGIETSHKNELDTNQERKFKEDIDNQSLALKISNFRGISISSVYSEAKENPTNKLDIKNPLDNLSHNSSSVILERKEDKRTLECSKGAIESESINATDEKVENEELDEKNLNTINNSPSIEKSEIEKKIEGFKGISMTSLKVTADKITESNNDSDIAVKKDDKERLESEEKTENASKTVIDDIKNKMLYSIESKGYTNKSLDISKNIENDSESNKSMDCELSINSKESLLQNYYSLQEQNEIIKESSEHSDEKQDEKSDDNQKEQLEKQTDSTITPSTSIVDSTKDDANSKIKENDDSYSFPGIGKGLLDSIRDLNEQLSSESKNIDRENKMDVEGFEYKRKFVEETRSSIIKSAKQSENELKTTLSDSLTTNFEKTNKECDSSKMDIDNVRKIESFKGVSVSSVVIESKIPDESDEKLERNVDSKSEDEDKRDIEARRLKEDELRKEKEKREIDIKRLKDEELRKEEDKRDIEAKRLKDEELRKEEKEKDDRDSLAEAVRLVQNMGGIAIKRLETNTSEADSSNEKNTVSSSSLSSSLSDRVTISVRKEFQDDSNEDSKTSEKNSTDKTESESKIPEDKEVEQHISSLGGSVSVTRPAEKVDKEKDKKDVEMPSGVDTTRLSPSISIIAVSGSERTKAKTTTAPSSVAPSTTPVSSNPSPAPSAENAGAPSPATGAPSPRTPKVEGGIPPPPPLTHPQPPPSGPRGVFGPLPPGGGMLRGLPMPGHGMRMMGPGGPMHPGGPMRGPPPRHLPPEAGPLSTQLHKHSQKLAEIMRATLEDVLGGLVGTGTPEARLAALQLELERTSWRHQQELAEVRHNADVMLVEMRANLEAEKQRAVEEVRRQMEQQIVEMRRQMERQMVERISEVRRQMEVEKQRAVEETKKKQWCANCGKEALFFCCWNTSYCDYPCQQSHWPQHMSVCGQNNEGGSSAGESGGGASGAGSAAATETNEGNSGSMNGEASTHSSRNSTPVQNVGHMQQSGNNQIFSEMGLMGGGSSPANANHPTSMANSTGLPSGSPNLGTRSPGARGMGNLGGPAMAAMAAMAASGAGGPHGGQPGGMGPGQPGHANMKGGPHRYMPPNILQQQMYGGMDPRMMMMMGRGHMPPGAAAAAMMRSPMHPHFRPRFM